MFDLNRMHTLNLDQLHPWRIYELSEDLHTTSGRVCPRGMGFRFDHAVVNLNLRVAEIYGLGPADEELVFVSRGDAHRQWFVATLREWRPAHRKRAPPVPAGSEAAWLAAQPGFERASAILAGVYSTGHWGAAREDAEVLRAAALALVDEHPDVARWLADQCLYRYHAWMAQATSGGEGAAMQNEVRRELAQMRKLAGETTP